MCNGARLGGATDSQLVVALEGGGKQLLRNGVQRRVREDARDLDLLAIIAPERGGKLALRVTALVDEVVGLVRSSSPSARNGLTHLAVGSKSAAHIEDWLEALISSTHRGGAAASDNDPLIVTGGDLKRRAQLRQGGGGCSCIFDCAERESDEGM